MHLQFIHSLSDGFITSESTYCQARIKPWQSVDIHSLSMLYSLIWISDLWQSRHGGSSSDKVQISFLLPAIFLLHPVTVAKPAIHPCIPPSYCPFTSPCYDCKRRYPYLMWGISIKRTSLSHAIHAWIKYRQKADIHNLSVLYPQFGLFISWYPLSPDDVQIFIPYLCFIHWLDFAYLLQSFIW